MHNRIEILTEPDMEREGRQRNGVREERQRREGLRDGKRGQQNGHDGETSGDMKADDKSAKTDAEWNKDARREEEERQKEGGGTAVAKLKGPDMVTY